MKRREFLGLSAGVLGTSLTYADCRDENRIPQPAEGTECLALDVRSSVEIKSGRTMMKTARAVFGFGAYERLLEFQKDRRAYPFAYQGKRRLLAVTRLSVDVNRELGCVVCEVYGRLYS